MSSQTARRPAAPTPVVPRRGALALTAVLATQLMLQLDAQVVTVALPQVQQELGFTAAGLSWVPNAYALAFGGFMLLGGRLGDIMGRARAFETGTALFALASLAAGLAQDPTTMIIARVVQGIGAAVAAPSILALITAMARDEAARRHGLAMFTAASAVGSSVGLILGGALTAFASWRWGLLINVPIGILVVLVVHRLVRETARARGSIDVAGAATATAGSLSLVYGFIHAAEAGWSSAWTIVSFALAVLLLASFVLVERRVRRPLLDLTLLRHRGRAAALVIMGLIVGVHFAMLFLLVQYFQRVLGMGALVAGLAFLPLTFSVLGLTQFVPALIRRLESGRLLVLGSLLVAVSFVWFAALDTTSTYFGGVFVALLLHSIGVSLVFTPATVMIMEDVAAEHTGSMSGFLQMVQQIGGSLGIAVIVAVYVGGSRPGQFVPGLAPAFFVAAAIAALAVLAALTTLTGRRRTAVVTPAAA
ncbi:MFS transporter [Pseudonocardia sp. KRD-182]|uniref:MFS transporter n=1 Tax=Pseudonocardia oceani TaxID=2792013 RepID=UPI001C49E18B|nr:MFS transporter [Pseudonocardia oceani]MBW0110159.1 MFS transporter [Pseudonocardia oceani]